MKHNKKRNTAFLYESLIKELTKTILKKDQNKKDIILKILKESFSKKSTLRKDLEIYNSILNNEHKMTREFSNRFIHETKKDYLNLNRKKVFNQQSKLIEKINKNLSNLVFRNFIPNYKNIATVGQWLNSDDLGAKSRLLIEARVIEILTPKQKLVENMQHIDSLTYRTFINKFNKTYEKTLRKEQKSLLTNYIVSFSDNGLGLKTFMNEEIGRLKSDLVLIIENNTNVNIDKSKNVLSKLDGFKEKPIDESMVRALFYIQDLIEVLKNDS